jgi:hypothetical protein
MEYHNSRFEDNSLLIFKSEKLVALLPANIDGSTIYSHQGLSYGGLVLSKEIKFNDVLEVFKTLLKYLNHNAINVLELKQMPSIYHLLPSDETQYLMFLLEAKLIKREMLSVINQKGTRKFSNSRKEGIRRGEKNGLIITEENSFDDFWDIILNRNLKTKHNVTPVHTLEEITLLKQCFPKNIRQFNVFHNNTIVAGATIFETKNVAHVQYISGNKDKNTLGSLDFLHSYLIKDVFSNKQYFDFGMSNLNEGKQINKGLQFWKEGFGALSITQDFYTIKTKNYKLLEAVFI